MSNLLSLFFCLSDSSDLGTSFIMLLILVGFFILLRKVWAWCLRINELISGQKESNQLLKSILEELRKRDNI